MSASLDALGPLAERDHPRLALLLLVGAAAGLLGAALWLTAGPLGHGFGTAGFRLAALGLIVFAFGASGVIAFAVFERGFA